MNDRKATRQAYAQGEISDVGCIGTQDNVVYGIYNFMQYLTLEEFLDSERLKRMPRSGGYISQRI